MTILADLNTFIGRFHPLVVHLPIGLLVALALTGVCFRRANVKAPERLLLGLLAASCIAAAVFGWLLASGGGYNDDILSRHRWMGIGVAVGCAACLVLHFANRFKTYGLVLAATLLGVGLVGHDGGSLTHGSDYLTRYMPNGLRSLIGLGPRVEPPPIVITTVADTAVYDAIVYPIFENNCISCHGPEKSRGNLRMDTHEAVLAGGREGPLVLVDNPSASPLLTRIHLPPDDEEHMPPPGKTPLTSEQKKVLEWWMQVGAPFEGTVAQIDTTLNTEVMLEQYLGLAEPAPEPQPLAAIAEDAKRIADELGLRIEPVAESKNILEVTAQNVASFFDDDQLRQLDPLAANIVELNLANTKVTDQGLETVAQMTNLRRLWLNGTQVTDAGLSHLSRLRELRYLNLYGTVVTDAGLPSLAVLPHLSQLYLWQTQVSPEAATAFVESSVDRAQLEAWRQEIAAKQKLIEEAGTRIDLGRGVALDPQTKADPQPETNAH
ncbi:MAG: c-type cytochrome domain-containing protein [Planctomycetota bacterium]